MSLKKLNIKNCIFLFKVLSKVLSNKLRLNSWNTKYSRMWHVFVRRPYQLTTYYLSVLLPQSVRRRRKMGMILMFCNNVRDIFCSTFIVSLSKLIVHSPMGRLV